MYARITSFEIDPGRLDELPEKIKKIQSLTKALPGIVDIYIAWRADGRGKVVAIYQSKAEADRAVGRLQAVWGDIAGLLKVAPHTDTYETVAHVVG